jgi:hypothetical protein
MKQHSFLTELIDQQKEEETENKIGNGMTIIDEIDQEIGYKGFTSETDNDSLHDLSHIYQAPYFILRRISFHKCIFQ